MGHGLFASKDMVFNSNGILINLPLPLSLLGILLGIFLFFKSVRLTSFLVVALFVIASVISFLVTTFGHQNQTFKLLLLSQYLLPMLGLIFGEMYGSVTTKPIFEVAAILTLILVLPIVLVEAWLDGSFLPKPTVLYFSIYQHLQYFPMIVSALLILIMFGAWGQSTWTNLAVLILIPFSLMYVVGAVSITASFNMIISIFLFICIVLRRKKVMYTVMLSAFIFIIFIIFIIRPTFLFGHFKKFSSEHSWIYKLKYDANNFDFFQIDSIVERRSIWSYYIRNSFDSANHFLFGHNIIPERDVFSSAHNYWLDLLYNFGFISLLPFLFFIGWVLLTLFRYRYIVVINSQIFGLAYAVLYLVILENFLKVGMRQPYPGLITFFLLGVLFARLIKMAKSKSID